MNKKTIVAHPMWNDAHTEGPIEFLRIAADHNNKIDFIPPSDDLENFIKTIETRQGLKISCIEEIAYKYGYIDKSTLIDNAKKYNNEYGNYLMSLIND